MSPSITGVVSMPQFTKPKQSKPRVILKLLKNVLRPLIISRQSIRNTMITTRLTISKKQKVNARLTWMLIANHTIEMTMIATRHAIQMLGNSNQQRAILIRLKDTSNGKLIPSIGERNHWHIIKSMQRNMEDTAITRESN